MLGHACPETTQICQKFAWTTRNQNNDCHLLLFVYFIRLWNSLKYIPVRYWKKKKDYHFLSTYCIPRNFIDPGNYVEELCKSPKITQLSLPVASTTWWCQIAFLSLVPLLTHWHQSWDISELPVSHVTLNITGLLCCHFPKIKDLKLKTSRAGFGIQ